MFFFKKSIKERIKKLMNKEKQRKRKTEEKKIKGIERRLKKQLRFGSERE